MQSVQVKLCYPLTMHDIPECLRDVSCRGATQIDYLYLYLYGGLSWPRWLVVVTHQGDCLSQLFPALTPLNIEQFCWSRPNRHLKCAKITSISSSFLKLQKIILAKFLIHSWRVFYVSSNNTLQNMTPTKTIKVRAIKLLLSRSNNTCFSGQHGCTKSTRYIITNLGISHYQWIMNIMLPVKIAVIFSSKILMQRC